MVDANLQNQFRIADANSKIKTYAIVGILALLLWNLFSANTDPENKNRLFYGGLIVGVALFVYYLLSKNRKKITVFDLLRDLQNTVKDKQLRDLDFENVTCDKVGDNIIFSFETGIEPVSYKVPIPKGCILTGPIGIMPKKLDNIKDEIERRNLLKLQAMQSIKDNDRASQYSAQGYDIIDNQDEGDYEPEDAE